MKIFKGTFLFFLLLLTMVSSALAIGVRPLMMGGAFSAISDDEHAIYYNPAGLSASGFSYTFGNLNLSENGGDYNFLKVGQFGYGDLRRFSNGTLERLKTYATGFYSQNGLNLGLSYQDLYLSTGNYFSSDLGALLRINPSLNLALVFKDIIKDPDLNLPLATRVGMGFFPFSKRLKLALDSEFKSTAAPSLHLGTELSLAEGLTLSFGLDNGKGSGGITLKPLPFFEASYGYLYDETSPVKRMAFSFTFPTKEDRELYFSRSPQYVVLNISGSYVAGRDEFSFLGGKKPGIDDLLEKIKAIGSDDEVDGVILRVAGFKAGFASLAMVQELRRELLKVKKKGKKIVAFIESQGVGEAYYLASVADQIVAPPLSTVGGLSRMIGIIKFKGVFEKFGIEWEVVKVGEYKDTFAFMGGKLSPSQKTEVVKLTRDFYRQMLNDISSDRKMKKQDLKEIADGRFFLSSKAKELGLIDEIGFFEDSKSILKRLIGTKEKLKKVAIYQNPVKGGFLMPLPWESSLAIIEIDGELVDGKSGENLIFGGRFMGGEEIAAKVRKARENDNIKAILLRINSPGGSPIAANQIYQELLKAKKKQKLVVASVGDMAVSGGYYIAAGADEIVASPSSLIGGIGVIAAFPTFHKLADKFGAQIEVVKEGKHADMFSGLRRLTTEEKEALISIQKEIYHEFKGAVELGRGLTTDEVESLAQGKIYAGNRAHDLRLIDELGNFSDAIELVRERLKVGPSLRKIYFRKEPDLNKFFKAL